MELILGLVIGAVVGSMFPGSITALVSLATAAIKKVLGRSA